MTKRARFSATIEADVLAAGHKAVARGQAESLSAWVNTALRRQADHDRHMQALDVFLAAYEAEHGEISDAEIVAASRRARDKAIVVRPNASPTGGCV